MAHRIQHIHEAHSNQSIPAGITRISEYSPSLEQMQEGILKPDYDEDTVLLYDTPYNDFFAYLPTLTLKP